jgi:hypothetical protein
MNSVSGESQNPFVAAPTKTATTSTSTVTTQKPADHISVSPAVINNGTLMMTVKNSGPSTTQLLTVTDVCTPGFKACYDYNKLAGSYYTTTFVLPAAKTFVANLTGVCTMALPKCKAYLPIANATYFLTIKFDFADGSSVTVPVSAKANNTWSPHNTAVTGVWPSMTVVPANFTVRLNVTLAVNQSTPWGSFNTLLEGSSATSKGYTLPILSNQTGCENADVMGTENFSGDGHRGGPLVNYTGDCTVPLMILLNATTVMTGITPGAYYALVVRDVTDIDQPPGYPNFDGPSHTFAWWSSYALWIQGNVSPTT